MISPFNACGYKFINGYVYRVAFKRASVCHSLGVVHTEGKYCFLVIIFLADFGYCFYSPLCLAVMIKLMAVCDVRTSLGVSFRRRATGDEAGSEMKVDVSHETRTLT